MKHRAAGADLPVFRLVGFPVVALMVMGVALSIEHGQGLARCIQILAFVCPRVSIVVALASLEQRQHFCAIGKFRFGLGLCFCDVVFCTAVANCVQSCTVQIVAVFYSGKIKANDFANLIAVRDRSNVVAIGDRTVVLTCNAANSEGRIVAAIFYCTNVIAFDDLCIVIVIASNTTNRAGNAARNAAMVAAIFDHSI